jgi:hypothetical protein
MAELSQIKSLIARGEHDSAIQELVSLLRTSPRNVEAWLLLADLREDPREQKDCYKQVLKLDPYNAQAQLQLKLLGGTSMLKLNVPESRWAEPALAPAPLTAPEPLPVLELPPEPEPRPAPPMESSAVAPEMLLRSLRTEATSDAPLPSPPEEEPISASAPPVLPDYREVLKDIPDKLKPIPGKTARFVGKNRPAQVILMAVGIALAMFLFLLLWTRLIPYQAPATLIVGPAKKYIPAQADLPKGFTLLATPAGSALISLPNKAEGYRMVFTNPAFAPQHRETIVVYEVLIYNNEIDAQADLLTAANPISYTSLTRLMESDALAPGRLARVDFSALLFGRRDQTLQGTPAISYTVLLRTANLNAKVQIIAPIDDRYPTMAQDLRGSLYQAAFYYTALLTRKLPLPSSSQVQVEMPIFPTFAP